ncbi:M15 family metallopeptidase [Chromatium okenii]|uniref:M15 family metallopeptidase n=1 Tax=Chromatium okenii TaxID=61644 RepID=UPI0026ED7BC1|nr:M15 family metallopeptidase [Chromatium okenii]MBV5311538.1 M15 family metallopeptidase [Chromatium okenii]
MTFHLSTRSLNNLIHVHPDLIGVVELAIQKTPVDFCVTEGLRSPERQARLVKAGASKTLKSRHLTGHAVDLAAIVDGKIRWDWPLYFKIAEAMKAAAKEENVSIVWGGDWKMKDGPHFELSRKVYPATRSV